MTIELQPSDEGQRRYPYTAGYSPIDGTCACTCTPSCPLRCDGLCGCVACSLAFTVFCDECGFLGPTGLTVPMAEALQLYRGA